MINIIIDILAILFIFAGAAIAACIMCLCIHSGRISGQEENINQEKTNE